MKYSVEGQLSFFNNEEVIVKSKPAKHKIECPVIVKYPYRCNIGREYVTVYAVHERQAYVVCKKVYGCCIGTPVRM